eukprot:TRINITY_DN3644_c0_g1_i1.p1 TRINITY_DN3644_c0_g1~~TRINITY_DN3644_c0_g1_i1.p1  ORF type:complete len:506 (+),score=89.72 TRINITY_DN3644_c0_g1_i1:62-1579(+)
MSSARSATRARTRSSRKGDPRDDLTMSDLSTISEATDQDSIEETEKFIRRRSEKNLDSHKHHDTDNLTFSEVIKKKRYNSQSNVIDGSKRSKTQRARSHHKKKRKNIGVYPKKVDDVVTEELQFITVNNIQVLSSGGLNAVLTHILENTDNNYINMFLLSYGIIIPSEDMVAELRKMFSQHVNDMSLQIRMINLMKKWIETSYSFISDSEKAVNALEDLIISLKEIPHLEQIATVLEIRLNAKLNGTDELPHYEIDEEDIPNPILPNRKPFNLFTLHSLELARQLTLIDHDMLSKIDIKEFYKFDWGRKLTGSISSFRERNNQLVYWYAYAILMQDKIKLKVKALGYILNLGKKLIQLNNYNHIMIIYLALSLSPVSNLTTAWRLMSTKKMLVWNKIKELASPEYNYNRYRREKKKLDPNAPSVIMLEVILTDLLYYEELYPNYNDPDMKVINMLKISTMGALLEEVSRSQTLKYALQPVAEIQEYLMDIRTYTMEDLIGLNDSE